MSAQSVIRNFMSYLDSTALSGTAALDGAVSSVSNFKSWSELINTMSNDCAAYAGDGNGFLQEMCDIILNNSDTGAITGSDAGSGSTKTAESVVPESGEWTYPAASSFTVNGLTVNINNFDNLDASERWIVGALYTWWVKEGLNLINSSFGMNFNEAGTTVKTLNVYFYNSADGKMAFSNYSTGQKSSELRLNINMHYYENIDTTNPNGVGSSAALTTLDRTIAHELVHAVMSANVDYYNNLPVSFKEGSAELVHGIDDKRYNQIVALSNDAAALKNAMSESGLNSYAAGYIALRYLGKQASEGRDPSVSLATDETVAAATTDTVASTTDTVAASTTNDTLQTATTTTATSTAATETTATALASNVTFDGTTLKIYGATNQDVFLSDVNPFTDAASPYANATAIVLDASEMTDAHFLGGNLNNNVIIASNVGSTTWGGTGGDDVLQGGAGFDNFWYMQGNGNDVALNFQTGAAGDMISFLGWGVTGFYRENNVVSAFFADGGTFTAATDDATANNAIKFSSDAVNPLLVKLGSTNLTNDFIYEGDGIVYMGGNNVDALHVFTAGSNVNLGNGFYSSIEVLDATWSSGANVLFGDAINNVIISGGNNSALWGGAGDDVIYGGTGTDYFLFGAGEGNDILCNVEDDDFITLYNATSADLAFAQETETGMILGVGANVLTVVGQSNTAISFADGVNLRYNRAAKTWTTA